MEKMYKLIFCSGNYRKTDFVGTYDQCCEVRSELSRDMYLCGERDFYYIIKEC